MAGHGRTSWDDVAVVTVSILRLVARYEKQNGEGCRRERISRACGHTPSCRLGPREQRSALSRRWRSFGECAFRHRCRQGVLGGD